MSVKGGVPLEMLIEKLIQSSSADYSHVISKHHQKKIKHKGHSHHARVLVDRVLADEVVTCCEKRGPCDIGVAVSPCSVLNGTINVTVLKCMPVFCGPRHPVQVELLLCIQKELVVIEPSGRKIPLEFTFYQQCRERISCAELECIDLKSVHCLVSDVQKVRTHIDFICANPAFNGHATIAEQLEIVLKLKLVVSEQLDVSLRHLHRDDFHAI